MSNKQPHAASPAEPRRPLRADFTAHTMRQALAAKRRAHITQQSNAFRKESFSMKSFKFLRTAPGAALAVAIVATSGVGAYALVTNWFGATATNSRQSGNVISVDLSGCKADMPGVKTDQAGTAKFKITAAQHISPTDLQQELLASCEAYTVLQFYAQQSPYAAALTAPAPTNPDQAQDIYNFQYGNIVSMNAGNTVTVDYRQVGSNDIQRATLPLTSDAKFYSQGAKVDKASVGAGDNVVLLTKWNGTAAEAIQKYGGEQNMNPDSAVVSLYKTTNDVKNSMQQKDFFQKNGVQPLE